MSVATQNFPFTKQFVIKVFESIIRSRMVDEKMHKLVRQSKGGSFHLFCNGHEMVGAVAGLTLQPGVDWLLPYYRDRATVIGLGAPLVELFEAFLARDSVHHSGGRMMPEHFSHLPLRIPCQSSCVGSQFLQAVGVAKSVQLSGFKEVVYVSGGDGSTSQGDFHEMLNFASLHRLPLVIVIQDNGWAISVPVSEQTAGGTISTMAKGYEGLDVHEIDGTDFVATTMVMEAACARARAGSGPSLIVAHVPRLGPHSSSDDPKKYQTDTVRAECVAADPVPRFKAWLIQQGILDAAEIEFIERRISVEVEEAAVLAEATDRPSPDTADQHVFQASPVTETPSQTEGESIVLMDAIAHAITEEMEDDPKVIVFGQDVAHGKGGVFGITRGLTETFGPHRCFNTPLAESTIIGLAIGLSATGRFKPIAEIQFVDYSWTGMNQIVNELASYHYRSKGQWRCPVVIRMPYGGYIQGGPYHSQSIEAIFAHCPGLKIVIPSNAADAKRLFKAALRDPNPVIFLEHKALYRQRLFSARPEPDRFALLPLGKAAVIREGTDLTYVGWGMTALMGYEAAEALAKEGISIEVIDLRTIVPLDEATILSSVKKTGKLLVAHEAPKNCGVGAEIVARLSEAAFSYLDAPPQRIASLNCPVPYSKELEDAVLPQKETILSAMRELASY